MTIPVTEDHTGQLSFIFTLAPLPEVPSNEITVKSEPDLTEVLKQAQKMLASCQIPYSEVQSISWMSHHSTTVWGRCTQNRRTGIYQIAVNSAFRNAGHETALLQTVIHELIHTIPGCMNHGSKWKNCAEKVNQRYGLHVSRTNSANSMHMEDEIAKNAKYVLRCANGHMHYKTRASNLTRHPEWYRCQCGAKLKLIRGENEK